MNLNKADGTGAPLMHSGDPDVEDDQEPAVAKASKTEADLAAAVAKHLLPKVEVMLERKQELLLAKLSEQRVQLDLALHFLEGLKKGQEESTGFGTATTTTPLVTPRVGGSAAFNPELQRLIDSVESVSAKLDSVSLRRRGSSRRGSSADDISDTDSEESTQKRFRILEDRMAQKVEESENKVLRSMTVARQSITRAKTTDTATSFRSAHSDRLRSTTADHDEDHHESDRAVVINVRRFKAVIELSRVFTCMVHATPLAGFAIVVLSQGLLSADLAFLAATLLMLAVHYLRHGVMTQALAGDVRLGEHSGNDGQAVLDAQCPGMENPAACIQALTWRRKRHFVAAEGLATILWACSLAVWAYAICDSFITKLGWLTPDEVSHIVALNIVATCQLLAGGIYNLFMWREMHFVLPPTLDGQPWDITDGAIDSAWSAFLGPPCLYFGSQAAYDDFRIWVAMAAKRRGKMAGIQKAARFFPEELALYALHGRENATRLARSLYEAKLYDSQRTCFLKRWPEGADRGDERPSCVIKGLSRRDGKRGDLYDLDLRRDFPEALKLQLLLHDSRTGRSWMPKRVGHDPQAWASLMMWDYANKGGRNLGKSDTAKSEVPIWQPDQLFASQASADIAFGTFGGYRCLIMFGTQRGDVRVRVGDMKTEIRAMKKLGEHPNLTSLVTTGVSAEDQLYLAVESYEAVGCLLTQLNNHYNWSGEQIPSSVTKRVFECVMLGLAHMHDHHLLHRSLRAEGVIITHDQVAKLADVGLVERTGTSSKLKGSHNAPESCRGATQGIPVDCWGLGILLHELYQGRPDIMDCRSFPPKQLPGTPSGLRQMDVSVRDAMEGLLQFSPSSRWTVKAIRHSAWFKEVAVAPEMSRSRLTDEFQGRRTLRRYLSRAPLIPACALLVEDFDEGLKHMTLGELGFDKVGVTVLLVVRKSGAFSLPSPSVVVNAGDRICFGLPAESDADALAIQLVELIHELNPSAPPVPGFKPASGGTPVQSPRSKTDDLEGVENNRALLRLVPFHAEFDCFCFPNYTARVGAIDVGTLTSMGLPISGLVRTGEWLPEWLPHAVTEVKPGDLCLIFRAPRVSGCSVPIVTEADVDFLEDEQDILKRLAIARGLNDATASVDRSSRKHMTRAAGELNAAYAI